VVLGYVKSLIQIEASEGAGGGCNVKHGGDKIPRRYDMDGSDVTFVDYM
jgi:hypothetical protein